MIFKKHCISRKRIFLVFLISLIYSCEEEVNLAFSEINILEEEKTIVEINIPNAEGQDLVSEKINSALLEFTNNVLNIDSEETLLDTFEEGIEQFNISFDNFINNLNEEAKREVSPWEAIIEGEVTYQSNNVISIAMNAYTNTGAAHGTSKVSFLNFDASTGEILDYNQFIDDKKDFQSFLIKYFKKEVGPIAYEDFKLPETIGLNDEGIVILYNVNEIPSYTDKLIEFNIPFEEVKSYLKRY